MSCGIVWMIKLITKKGGPHLNICLGAAESPVTPLSNSNSISRKFPRFSRPRREYSPPRPEKEGNCLQLQDLNPGFQGPG